MVHLLGPCRREGSHTMAYGFSLPGESQPVHHLSLYPPFHTCQAKSESVTRSQALECGGSSARATQIIRDA